jgi:multiple sugar transport system permease protein
VLHYEIIELNTYNNFVKLIKCTYSQSRLIGGVILIKQSLRVLKKYQFLIPALVVIAITSTYPILYAFWLGFQRWMVWESPKPTGFIGFENFTRAFADPAFHEVAKTTFVYTVTSVSLSVGIGLAIALLLQKPSKMNTLLKMLLIFPFAISPALKGFTFKFMLHPSFGILDRAINFIFPFTDGIVWLNSTGWAIFWLSMSEVWGWAPLIALMFLGALGSISPSIFEAAKLDGTNNFQLFYRITLPLLKPVILVVVLLRIIFSLKMFDQVVTMTGGGPGTSTQVFNFFIYKTGFTFTDMGYDGALAAILVIFMAVVASLYIRMLTGREE